MLSIDLKSEGLVVPLYDRMRFVIGWLQRLLYSIVTHKNVSTLSKVFSNVRLMFGVMTRWCCSQLYIVDSNLAT